MHILESAEGWKFTKEDNVTVATKSFKAGELYDFYDVECSLGMMIDQSCCVGCEKDGTVTEQSKYQVFPPAIKFVKSVEITIIQKENI